MKKALIVDDSRLARTILGKLLSEHGVAADMAESAELALDYLKQNRPDVVFLDHNMPGIDGFQALDAIKTNPATATIPVMMYTSEEGEVYLGQARALGALGVLPKTLQPVEVVNVLRRLHLIPGSAAPQSQTSPEPSTSGTFDARPVDAARLREILEPLFLEHASSLREEMRRGLQRVAETSTPPPVAPPEPPRAPRSYRPLRLAAVIFAAVAITFGYLYYATRNTLDDANESVERLASDSVALSEAVARGDARSASTADAASAGLRDVVSVLEWGVNRGNRYAFGAIPLDDERATMLASLAEQLDRIGFEGRIAFEAHVGRFCMNYGSDGMLELAPPDQPATTCSQIGWPENEARALGARQSLAFANAVATAMARNPQIAVETLSRGSEDPEVDYPATGYELTAGVWNAVAAANHRVSVRIVPAPGSARR
jgi:CheY-like chemotaxis protein